MREVTIEVSGYPLAENEAKSMLAAGHVHAERVLDLPQATRAGPGGTVYLPDESPGLELVMTSPAAPPLDATNYLGDVADVLEDKEHRGDLAHFALYRNDRQFHDIRYRWELGPDIRYRVPIWAL